MSTYFEYEKLTWPEIYKLPRDIPLVIPLGSGYDMERLASALGNPTRAGILPPLPYGWSGSGLQVAEIHLGKYLYNLVKSLQDDGFSRVWVLTPQQVSLSYEMPCIALPHSSQFTSIQQPLPEDNERGKVVIIPIGHTEQHGYHSPMSTDTVIIEAIAQGAAQATPDRAVCLPVMPYGVSTHRASFAGTLNAGGRAFEDFFIDVVDLLAARGFDRFYFMSGHGGNS